MLNVSLPKRQLVSRYRLPRRLRFIWVSIAIRAWPLAQLWYRSWGLRLNGGPEDQVWGVIYKITLRELVRLNVTEGVPGPGYQPVELETEDSNGHVVVAVSYVAEGNSKDGKPSLRYINLLRDGAREHALPPHWIAHLEGVDHAD